MTVMSSDEARRELDAADALGCRFVARIEPDYPPALATLQDAPPLLCVLGDTGVLARPAVAIVGSRNASAAGRKLATSLAAGLGEAGYAVASGLARGVDTAAHTGALDNGTVAVMAGGLDLIYPPENTDLAEDIVHRQGALVTEMPLGHRARAKDFPRRNRIISGLSIAVLVVEAAARSGSLITARMAGEQGRPVYAVPGSPLDPRAAGTNLLIREGATLVSSVEDILSDIAPMTNPGGPVRLSEAPPTAPISADVPAGETDDSARAAVLEALGPSPVMRDDLVRFTGLPPAVVHLVLMELSLAGRLEQHPGQRVSLSG